MGFSRQDIFLTQGSNLGFPHCGQSLYHVSHWGSHVWGVILWLWFAFPWWCRLVRGWTLRQQSVSFWGGAGRWPLCPAPFALSPCVRAAGCVCVCVCVCVCACTFPRLLNNCFLVAGSPVGTAHASAVDCQLGCLETSPSSGCCKSQRTGYVDQHLPGRYPGHLVSLLGWTGARGRGDVSTSPFRLRERPESSLRCLLIRSRTLRQQPVKHAVQPHWGMDREVGLSVCSLCVAVSSPVSC